MWCGAIASSAVWAAAGAIAAEAKTAPVGSKPAISSPRFQKQVPPAPPTVPPQPDPNDRFPTDPERPDPEPLEPDEEDVIDSDEETTPDAPTEETETQFFVSEIEVRGSTILSEADIAELVGSYENRQVTLSDLREAADQITQEYLNRDYITSRAILPDQTIAEDGIVIIQVIEGSLQQIDIEGTNRVNDSYVRSRIELGAGQPLNTSSLEDQLRLLRADPLFESVEASLRAGDNRGQSILIVRVTEAPPFRANISLDNYSPASVGSERLGANLRYRNLTGIGDDIFASYTFTDENGSDSYDLSYRVPVNPMNGTLQLRFAPNRNEIIQDPFDEFGIRGETDLYEVNFRQPLMRSPRREFALSLGFAHQDSQTFTDEGPTPFGIGPDEDGISRTSVLRFGQDYVARDVRGAWAFRSQFNVGTQLFDATENDGGDIPDGQFFSWLAQAQRVQRLGEDHLLIVQFDAQLTPDPLLPSQQFVIGGGQSLRGYRQNARSGDNGYRFSVEDRITLDRDAAGIPRLQVAPFIDLGGAWNVQDNPNPESDQQFLIGVGVGLFYEPLPGLRIRLDYGLPLVDLDDRGDNLQDDGIYFSIGYGLQF